MLVAGTLLAGLFSLQQTRKPSECLDKIATRRQGLTESRALDTPPRCMDTGW